MVELINSDDKQQEQADFFGNIGGSFFSLGSSSTQPNVQNFNQNVMFNQVLAPAPYAINNINAN